jgi:xanthine dehydrogenase molybdopterin-binding subunit B
MIMAAVTLLKDNPKPWSGRSAGHLGNFCRCTGYQRIVNAIQYAASKGKMAASPVLPKLVGQRVKRREDPRLIRAARPVDDIALVGMQHLAFRRSDVAHGRIASIDTSAAEAMEGVEAVFTGAQIAAFVAPMPIGTPFPSPNIARLPWTPSATGQAVAVVVASDRYVARDAADAIVVSYDTLPAVVNLELRDDRKAGGHSSRVSK